MYVESDTLLPNESCNAIVKPLFGKFELPDDSALVSGVYDVCLHGDKLHKPIMLEIQHCVDLKTEEQCKLMQFVVAEEDSSPFNPVHGGEFLPFSQYGRLRRKEFSRFGIVHSDTCAEVMYIYMYNKKYKVATTL